MTELTGVEALRPGVWIAEDDGQPVLVREITRDRCGIYEAAQQLPLPIPVIRYVGPDFSGDRHLLVEERLEAEGGSRWRALRAVAPAFVARPDRLRVGLRRAVEALAWLHGAGFFHGYLTPATIYLNPDGSVCLAGLDCLQRAGQLPAPCVAYSRSYPCREQLDGQLLAATDVRLVALAFVEVFLGRHPLGAGTEPAYGEVVQLAARSVRLSREPRVLGLLEEMGAADPAARPDLREIVSELRRG